MPSAATANGKSEKAASSEATDNSPIRQIMTIIEHKIRNLEKRKSKLTSYRDLQKAGKELKADQKVAVAKYDEVAQTLEFARDLSKQVTSIAISAERDAKKLAKKETWVRYTADTNKIREVLTIQDCLTQMGCSEAREHFLNGTNGAAKLSADDLKVLDELYPEVTPKHEANEEGQPGFQAQVIKAAEHLYAIIDGKQKEVLGTTYSHVKEVIAAITECGYFDKTPDVVTAELANEENCVPPAEETQEVVEELVEPVVAPVYPAHVSIAVAPAVVPAAYPIRPHTTVTLQEIEHAYFAQQYPPQQRPIAEVIGSQNFFFLQESEIDSPVGTPQPPQILNQPSPPAPIPTQTFTNQHYVQMPRVGEPTVMPMQHYPHPEVYSAVPLPQVQPLTVEHAPQQPLQSQPLPQSQSQPQPQSLPQPQSQPNPQQPSRLEESDANTPTPAPAPADANDEWYEGRSPERDDTERKSHGQGDSGQNRFRRYNRGGGRPSNGYRGRGGFQSRQSGDGYHGQYQGRSNQSRQYGGDGYQSRHGNNKDAYYGNGDAGETQNENGRDRYGESSSYGGGFKSRGRGGSGRGGRGAQSGGAGRGPRAHHFRKHDGGAE